MPAGVARSRWTRALTPCRLLSQVLAADLDLLNPPADFEKRKHKLKRLVQSPNSFFMDVKCQVRPRPVVLPAAALHPRHVAVPAER